ncbi:MAG: hypothetical protein HOO06_05680 [Bdellovibrionaceae bacterium]|jgi:hypothetical protein|nr:hypothetical protein [Pseudobdellovibrionaceae bacterium]
MIKIVVSLITLVNIFAYADTDYKMQVISSPKSCFDYYVWNDEVRIRGFKKNGFNNTNCFPDLVIPSEIDGKKVSII